MHPEERERLRNLVAAEHGFQLYRSYAERDGAAMIGWDYSTLKRKRRAGLVPFVDRGSGSVGYMGYHLADIIVFGIKSKHQDVEVGSVEASWADTASETTRLASGGLDSGTDQPAITASAMMPRSK